MGNLTIRIDDKLKLQAEEEFTQLGVSHTEVVISLYRYIIEKHRLPYLTDEDAMNAMKARLIEVVQLASGLSINVQETGRVNKFACEALVIVLERFTKELESNWAAMKSASRGYLSTEWTKALQSAKGLSYLLTMTSSRCDGSYREFALTSEEIAKVVQFLVVSNKHINAIEE